MGTDAAFKVHISSLVDTFINSGVSPSRSSLLADVLLRLARVFLLLLFLRWWLTARRTLLLLFLAASVLVALLLAFRSATVLLRTRWTRGFAAVATDTCAALPVAAAISAPFPSSFFIFGLRTTAGRRRRTRWRRTRQRRWRRWRLAARRGQLFLLCRLVLADAAAAFAKVGVQALAVHLGVDGVRIFVSAFGVR